MSSLERVRRLVGRALAGFPVDDTADIDRVVDLAIDEAVGPLLAETLNPESLPWDVAARLTKDVRLACLHLAVLDEELRRVLIAFHETGIQCVVMKGAHLGRRIYRAPHLRPRADTDLLIEARARADVAAVLARCGYQRALHVRGEIILGQFHFERRDRAGISHNIDVHWRVTAPLVLDRALPAQAILDASDPFPQAGSGARAPSLQHALAIACVHLAAHHLRAPRLLWLYDLHLLSAALDDDEQEAFCSAAAAGGYCAIAAHALQLAHSMLPFDNLGQLASRVASGRRGSEPSAALLHRRRPLDDLLLDLRVAGWRDRARLLREHVLPDASYMRTSFSDLPLGVAYAYRTVRGLRRWLNVGTDAA